MDTFLPPGFLQSAQKSVNARKAEYNESIKEYIVKAKKDTCDCVTAFINNTPRQPSISLWEAIRVLLKSSINNTPDYILFVNAVISSTGDVLTSNINKIIKDSYSVVPVESLKNEAYIDSQIMIPGDNIVQQKFNSIIHICIIIIQNELRYTGDIGSKIDEKFTKLGETLFAERDKHRSNLIKDMERMRSNLSGDSHSKRAIGAGRTRRRNKKRKSYLNRKSCLTNS